MPSFIYIVPWLELFFALLGWGALVGFCWRKGWLFGNSQMSNFSGVVYSLGTGALFGLMLMGIIIGHFGLF